MSKPKRSLLREYRDILAKAPPFAHGVMMGIGLRNDPASRSALDMACEWQEAVLRIAAVSDVDVGCGEGGLGRHGWFRSNHASACSMPSFNCSKPSRYKRIADRCDPSTGSVVSSMTSDTATSPPMMNDGSIQTKSGPKRV